MGPAIPPGGMNSRRAGLAEAAAGAFSHALLHEADRWFLWIPVLFGGGIGLYFSRYTEPTVLQAVAGIVAASAFMLFFRPRPALWALAAAGLCVALGFANAKLRTAMLATPVLEDSAGAVTLSAHVERTEPRLPESHRLTLRVFAVSGFDEGKTFPDKVRVTSRFKPPPATGDAVSLRAVLRPVPEPVMPGGFDFARKAWFSGIGASGFAISAHTLLPDAPEPPLWLRVKSAIDAVRGSVDSRIRAALPGDQGAIASALVTGERGRIPEHILEALRHSGLAHVLAISGLHMALMAGSFYWLARALMAAWPQVALRLPIKKIAAVIALGGATFYLMLSGAGIATQRAYLMMGIFFLSIVLDRPAITLRNVALAAIVVLALFPESLFDVGFQMSFAATAALVAAYEHWGGRTRIDAGAGAFSNLLRGSFGYFTGIALTTLVAGLAVAPFAAFHFHKLAQYSLIGNLAAMPFVGAVIMPMALTALLVMPFGLEAWPLWAMGQGIDAVTEIAATVSAWDGAVIRIATIPAFSLVAMVLGGLWLILWREQWRVAGLLFAAIGLAASGEAERPDMLIGRDGAAMAVRSAAGRLTAPEGRGGTYSLERWLAAYADERAPGDIRSDGGFSCDWSACVTRTANKRIALVRHPSALREECLRADIVVTEFPVGRHCRAARLTVDLMDLKAHGAHALYLSGQSIRVETVAQMRGERPWTRGGRRNAADDEIPDDRSVYAVEQD